MWSLAMNMNHGIVLRVTQNYSFLLCHWSVKRNRTLSLVETEAKKYIMIAIGSREESGIFGKVGITNIMRNKGKSFEVS